MSTSDELLFGTEQPRNRDIPDLGIIIPETDRPLAEVEALEPLDTGAGREFDERPGDVEASIGIIIPDVGIIIPDTDRPLAEIEALESIDPVAAAMLPTAELSVEVPTESFDGLAIDDSAAIFDKADLDDGF